jgi:antibiotic biosynthesis monooxygenase (ABM) superfamily enzyme
MNKYQACAIARRIVESQGFICDGVSSQSEASYWRLPGYIVTLRIAAHACRHGYGVAAWLTFDYREAWERDEERLAWISDEEEVEMAVTDAIADYMRDAEREDEEEG